MSAISVAGRCVCGVENPTLEASSEEAVLLKATCCDALYLDRGTFVSLLRNWRVPLVEEYEQARQAARSEGGAS